MEAVGGAAPISALGLSSAFVSSLTRSSPSRRRLGRAARTIASDDSWFAGPPYAVPEEVFDEHSMDACSLSPDADNE